MHNSKRVLMISFHYPPIQGSSGFNRVLAFSKYLLESKWQVTVLTVTESAYSDFREQNNSLIPNGVDVLRASAIDGQRDLSFKGKHLKFFSLPDRWQSWIFSGVWKGLKYIKQEKPSAIFSTYPIASAHCIAYILSKATGLPWVADFRDPMAQKTWPPTKIERKVYAWIEEKVFKHATRILVTTDSTAKFYTEKFPKYKHKIEIIANGYDDETFNRLSAEHVKQEPEKLTLLHSGSLSPRDRNPSIFLDVLAKLKQQNQISSSMMAVVFRASGQESYLENEIRTRDLADLVAIKPAVDYQTAVQEMFSSQALLVFQGETCDRQIPAKIYEYMYVEKPILALTHSGGDTQSLLNSVENAYNAEIEEFNEIQSMLSEFLKDYKNEALKVIPSKFVRQYSRKNNTLKLASILEEITNKQSTVSK